MMSRILFFFLSLAFLSINLYGITSHAASTVIRCRGAERRALLDFKHTLRDPSNRLSSWVGKDCCVWQGVGCSNITAHVTKLQLRNEYDNLYVYYREWNKFALRGDMGIGWSLQSLEQLTHLDLSGNYFVGHTIPAFLGSFTRLTYLNLSYAGFTGKVPDQLGNLSALRHLDLSNNQYYNYGDDVPTLYVESAGWIGRLTSLRHLNMNVVTLKGTSNWFQALNALPHVQHVEFARCHLEGPFPNSPLHLNFTSLLTLNFEGNHINGNEPAWLYNITTLESLNFGENDIHWGSMHGSITRLASLKELDLSTNTISKSFLLSLSNLCKLQTLSLNHILIKDEMPNLEMVFSGCLIYSLEKLQLYRAQLNGSLPNSLESLTSLQYLDLGYNNLNVSIPNSLESLTSLQYLDLSYNNLNSSILNSLESLTSLQYLDLSHNNLSGSIPNCLEGLTLLQYLDLSHNNLNGTVAENIGQLKNLKELYLFHNSLSLSMIHLGNLSSLKYLDISFNTLYINDTIDWVPPFQLDNLYMDSCKLVPMPHFPKWLQTQTTLSLLSLAHASIQGTIPNWFPSSLQSLYLSNNNLTGEVPQNLTMLIIIDLSNNMLSGHLSPTINNTLLNLMFLGLSRNNFSGSIPHSLCQMNFLAILQLSYNKFSGELPDCWNSSSNAIILDFSNNQFSGKIPNTICNPWRIQSLQFSYNHFSSIIPLSLQDCKYLKILDIEHNYLVGNIPSWSNKSLSYLKVLNLRSNSLSGIIPELSMLTRLHILDLSNNNLSGSIPLTFGNFITMRNSYYHFEPINAIDIITYDSFKLFIKGNEYEYNNLYTLLPSIDLSNNNLSGHIPQELGNLHGLQSLNLSRNHLIGEIPRSINGIENLEALDLSRNNLSGAIPSTLRDLTFLGILNLSYNNLSGSIPTGRQLQTFDASTYIGNSYLCGPPLMKSCTNDIIKGSVQEEGKIDDKRDAIWLLSSIAMGFIIGFWGIWGILLFHKRWRTYYLNTIDKTYDKLCMGMFVKM